MTVVVGTAGHIDHGKTSLLRALTGMDADRLPEERRRGMTIDVGYAHLDLDDGTSIDFVDVPGHDALIGNMLVGAGEIDAAMLVVAADDGPRAQTMEHLALLDALGILDGLAVVTKVDVAGRERAHAVAAEVRALLARSTLAGAPVVVASAMTGAGLDEVRSALARARDLVLARASDAPGRATAGPLRLAIDRAFAVRGRGAVVTGTLRGGELRPGDTLRVEPGGSGVRVRGLQVHHAAVAVAAGGRTAVNVTGVDLAHLPRGAVLTGGPTSAAGARVAATDRVLAVLGRAMGSADGRSGAPAWPPADGARLRLHIGTAAVDATVGRRGREAVLLPDGRATAVLRLSEPVATLRGDRAVLRRPSPGDVVAAVRIIDPSPAQGISRRRATPERIATLVVAVDEGDADAAVDAIVALHGVAPLGPDPAVGVAPVASRAAVSHAPVRRLVLAPDIRESLERRAVDLVVVHHEQRPLESGLPVVALRTALRTALRRLATVRRDDAVAADLAVDGVLADLVARRRLARDGDRLRDPSRAAGPAPQLAAAMDRLEALLAVPAPPPLGEAARRAGCPPEGVRTLEADGRIVRVEADLGWSAREFQRLAAVALAMAGRGPLTPAAFRDATATTRRVVMPLLEDLGRRGLLVRTPAGHVPGPRAPRAPREPAP